MNGIEIPRFYDVHRITLHGVVHFQTLGSMKSIRVRILFWKVIGAIGSVFFATCVFGSLYQHSYLPALGFVIFPFFSVLLLIAYGPIELNAQGIQMIAPIGIYGIPVEPLGEATSKLHVLLQAFSQLSQLYCGYMCLNHLVLLHKPFMVSLISRR